MFCRKCGNNLADGARFCNACGTPVLKQQSVDQGQASSGAPTFTPPGGGAAPTFTPPGGGSVPIFTPPGTNAKDSKNGAPVFTPPTNHSDGCYCHPNEPVVTNCHSCGRPLCRDCAENYQVADEGEELYPLCYDCARKVCEEHIQIHDANMKEVMLQLGITGVGMIVGAIIGLSMGAGGAGFIGGLLIGGCLLSFARVFFVECICGIGGIIAAAVSGKEGPLVALLKAIFNIFVGAVKAIFGTIKKVVTYTFYILRSRSYRNLARDYLQQITDYYQYSVAVQENKGVDLSILMQNGTLTNNSFAQAVSTMGEAQAMQNLHQATVTINEYGEIVRNFQQAA